MGYVLPLLDLYCFIPRASPRFDPIMLLTVPSTEKVLKTPDKQRSSPTYIESMCQSA